MPRFPDSRRRVAGISVLTILVVLAVLYALRRIPPNSPQDGRQKLPESGGSSPLTP